MSATGFRFSHTRSDASAPGGQLTVIIIAVAESLEEAIKLAGDILPAEGLRLIDQGDEVLAVAKRLKIPPGHAFIV